MAAAFIALCGSAPAWADDPALALRTASQRVAAANRDAGSVEKVAAGSTRERKTVEQRIADAVLLMGVKDYDRAADVLNRIVEKYPQHPTAYPDGLRLLGETYFKSKQYLSARRVFNTILQRQGEQRFAAYRGLAAARLVDIALRTHDLDQLDDIFAKIGPVSAGQDRLAYAKGKGLLAQGKLDAAAAALSAVGPESDRAHQARYLMGVAATEQAAPPPPVEGERAAPVPKGRYAKAVALFRDVTKLAPDTVEHRHVIDMAWLAIGRLLYESQQWTQAVAAYNRIGRDSPEFATMLFELAWVYVRLGDAVRAQRALEVLAVVAPDASDVADASLLRGDLMLRAGQFDKSLKVYESVRGTYEAMRGRLDSFLGANTDPGVYFDTLSSEQFELFETANQLPALALKWAREGENGQRAFAIIDDVAMSRRLIKESNDMIERLNAVLSSPNRIRALPALQRGAERGLGLINSLAMARMTLAHGMDAVSDDLDPQLAQARTARRALERRLGLVPVTASDFAGRERQATRQWNHASQALQRLELEVDTLQATINGLERIVKDGPQAGVVRSPQQVQQFKQSLDEQKRLVKYYRDQVDQLRRAADAGKVQVGFGDKRFVEDGRVREQYRQALWAEVRLAQGGGGGPGLAAYAGRVAPVLRSADQAEQRIKRALASIDEAVGSKALVLRKAVQRETANIVDYSMRLEQLDKEARLVVGEVAMHNFGQVRDRLRNIVLRADVGITEEAWELREEQLTRVRRLKIERARSEQRLQEELDEVLDDAGESEGE